jgi:hypothetical protein
VPLPVARDRQRIDREHLVAGGEQRLHPRAAVGLDPDHDLSRLIELAIVLTDVPPISSCSCAIPDMPSGNRRRTSLRPVSSWISMS